MHCVTARLWSLPVAMPRAPSTPSLGTGVRIPCPWPSCPSKKRGLDPLILAKNETVGTMWSPRAEPQLRIAAAVAAIGVEAGELISLSLLSSHTSGCPVRSHYALGVKSRSFVAAAAAAPE